MAWARVIAMGLLITVAGCQASLRDGIGIDGGEDPEGMDVTVPGVTPRGVTDPDRLATAHRDSLVGQSYTLRSTLIMNRSRNRQMRMERVLRTGRDKERFLFEQRLQGDSPFSGVNRPERNLTVWSDGDRALAAIGREGGIRFERSRPSSGWRMFHGEQAIRSYFDRPDETVVERIDYRGWLAYRIVATQTGDQGGRGVTVRAVAIVDTFGRIFTLRISGPAKGFAWIPGEGAVVITLEYTDIGETTVPRPGWLATANETIDTVG